MRRVIALRSDTVATRVFRVNISTHTRRAAGACGKARWREETTTDRVFAGHIAEARPWHGDVGIRTISSGIMTALSITRCVCYCSSVLYITCPFAISVKSALVGIYTISFKL